MKALFFIFFISFKVLTAYSQDESIELTDSIINIYKQEIGAQAVLLKNELEKEYSEYNISAFEAKVTVEFKIDTFLIERLMVKKLTADYTTYGMVNAVLEAETDYDKLLNKYYGLIIKKLNPADKELFKESQRNWLKYRDSERKFSADLTKDEYSGGGTIQQNIAADKVLEITKKRVFELKDYLSRFME